MSAQPSQRRFRLAAGLQDFCVLAGLVTLLALQMHNFADDPGVGWHLKTGQQLGISSDIPAVDPFLFSPGARRWVSDQWFSDLLFYKVFAAGSWPLLYALLAAVYLFTFFGVLYRGVCRITGSCLGASAAVFIAFKSAELHFILRPVLIGFFLFACTYAAIYEAIKDLRTPRPDLTRLYPYYLALPMIFLVWANAHPSFVLGLLLMFLLIASLILDQLVLRIDVPLPLLSRLVLLFGACVIITAVNPYGLDLHRSIFELSQSRYFMSLHSEWMSPDFKLAEGEFFLLSAGILLLSLFLAGIQRLRWRFFEFLLVAAFGWLALRSVRVLPFFGIAASVPLVYALLNFSQAALFTPLGPLAKLARMFRSLEEREQSTGRGFLVLAGVLLALIADAVVRDRVLLYAGPFGPSTEKYPYSCLMELSSQSAVRRAVVAAPPEWGGFITLYGHPGVRAIIDDRNVLLGEEFYRQFYEKMRVGAQFLPYLKSLGVTHLLVNKSSTLVPWINETGLLPQRYEDRVSVLFGVP